MRDLSPPTQDLEPAALSMAEDIRRRLGPSLFEAFDEPWKGSPEPDEPEKHWGLYTVDRKPKAVLAGKP